MKSELVVPEGVKVQVERGVVTVSAGEKMLSKKLDHPAVEMVVEGSKMILKCDYDSRKAKRLINTYVSHLKNLFSGLEQDFVYRLKVCSSHFPMDVSVSGDEVVIKNFLGERKSRRAKIVRKSEVEINGDVITITAPDKEAAGQTAANIENATRTRKKDRRRFQDGIYMMTKAGVDL
jgi:large subunit ribosomal protein L6